MHSPPKTRENIRALLVQARLPGCPTAKHELECFASTSRLPIDQITIVDALNKRLTDLQIEQYDLLFIGGAGDYSVVGAREEWLEDLIRHLRHAIELNIPTFGSCFGLQMLCVAWGGTVDNLGANSAEIGTCDLELTASGLIDPLFGRLGARFTAQQGHNDCVTVLPEEMTVLARSEKVGVQAIKIKDRPVYATQFHPEMTVDDNRFRYEHYVENYSSEPKDVDRIRSSFRGSPEANQLLGWFVEDVVLHHGAGKDAR